MDGASVQKTSLAFFHSLCGGELFNKVCEEDYLTETEACSYIKQVLSAMDYLHGKSIVHLDIKVFRHHIRLVLH